MYDSTLQVRRNDSDRDKFIPMEICMEMNACFTNLHGFHSPFMTGFYFTTAFTLLLSLAVNAQVPTISHKALSKRVAEAPENVFKMFREAGMDPVNHELTAIERAKIEDAFALLPPLHQKILNTHLSKNPLVDIENTLSIKKVFNYGEAF